jgi:hypothetical protein
MQDLRGGRISCISRHLLRANGMRPYSNQRIPLLDRTDAIALARSFNLHTSL